MEMLIPDAQLSWDLTAYTLAQMIPKFGIIWDLKKKKS